MYLFQEFFYEKNAERELEYIFCIKKNIENKSIKGIYLFVDMDEYVTYKHRFDNIIQYLNSNKVKLVPYNDTDYIKGRLTFNYLLVKHIPALVKSGDIENDAIAIIANLDIFIPDIEAWANINEELFSITGNKACMSLSRMEYVNDDLIWVAENSWKRGEFSDMWVFKLPISFTNHDFKTINMNYAMACPVGNAPNCDSFILEVLLDKYKVFNWAEKYKTYHYDVVRKPSVKNKVAAPMVINDKTIDLFYKSPQCLSPYENWEELLDKFKNGTLNDDFKNAVNNILNNIDNITFGQQEILIKMASKFINKSHNDDELEYVDEIEIHIKN